MGLPINFEKGPSQTLAFIPSADVPSIAETMVAFANAEGGNIFIGMGADGTVHDLSGEDVDTSLTRAQSLCRPPVRTEWPPAGRNRDPPTGRHQGQRRL